MKSRNFNLLSKDGGGAKKIKYGSFDYSAANRRNRLNPSKNITLVNQRKTSPKKVKESRVNISK